MSDAGSAAPVASAGRARGRDIVPALLSLITFQHTVFALPFAFMGAILASPDRAVGWGTALWILAAMIGARSAAMAFNRIADLEFDRRNPRTASRPLVTGALGVGAAWIVLAASVALFFASAAMLNRLALLLAAPALAILLGYSYAKRVTWLTHLHLGAALGMAPVGAWIAVAGEIDSAPLVLGAAVATWVAGFDVIYACQDVAFDRSEGLHSMPRRFGVARALAFSAALHAGTVALLMALPAFTPLGTVYGAGVALTAALLWYEHRLVRPDDLSRVDQAFFAVNGWIGFIVLVAAALDRLI